MVPPCDATGDHDLDDLDVPVPASTRKPKNARRRKHKPSQQTLERKRKQKEISRKRTSRGVLSNSQEEAFLKEEEHQKEMLLLDETVRKAKGDLYKVWNRGDLDEVIRNGETFQIKRIIKIFNDELRKKMKEWVEFITQMYPVYRNEGYWDYWDAWDASFDRIFCIHRLISTTLRGAKNHRHLLDELVSFPLSFGKTSIPCTITEQVVRKCRDEIADTIHKAFDEELTPDIAGVIVQMVLN